MLCPRFSIVIVLTVIISDFIAGITARFVGKIQSQSDRRRRRGCQIKSSLFGVPGMTVPIISCISVLEGSANLFSAIFSDRQSLRLPPNKIKNGDTWRVYTV